MASRTSASTGLIVTTVIFAVLGLASFVAFAVFFSKYSDEKKKNADMVAQNAEIVGNERNSDAVRALLEQAKTSEQRTLVGYLVAQNGALTSRISGERRDTLTSIEDKLKGYEGNDQPLVSMVQSRESRLANLQTELDQAKAARDQALADLKNEVDRVNAIDATNRETLEQTRAEVQRYKDQVEEYRKGADGFRESQAAAVERIRTEAEEDKGRLSETIKTQNEKILVLESQVAKLRGERGGDLLKPQNEATLVDGGVLSVNEIDRSVVISIGRDRKVVLGMTFAVYPNAASIKVVGDGEYTPGKATLEVINVGDTTATCRITSELRGNPVVRGDVLANAVYDPNKQYRFVVFGNFDTDRDGLATPAEKTEVENMVRAWGGTIAEDMSGDTDFVIMGGRPVLPPRPSATAPLEVALEYTRRFRDVERYDNLLREATATGIPVLNENRLYTLTGKVPQPVRRAGN
ncbi:MAG TPA: hypothetical protein VK157_13405 [Phycisphaerales bacterium]|nr:hypothetical protein [Phycisphaerales bacterium]